MIVFFFNDTATTEIYTLSLHDALPILLNYVRDRGPISRAEIARRTELQRSTVSEIVDCLLEEGLVEEVGAGRSTGGRCPTLLALRANGAAAVGIDIAPTHTTVAASDLAGR